jgi:hypothetical protein
MCVGRRKKCCQVGLTLAVGPDDEGPAGNDIVREAVATCVYILLKAKSYDAPLYKPEGVGQNGFLSKIHFQASETRADRDPQLIAVNKLSHAGRSVLHCAMTSRPCADEVRQPALGMGTSPPLPLMRKVA